MEEPVQCPGCRTISAPRANYCSTCGRPFTGDGEGVLDNPELVRKLLSDPIGEKKREGEL